jgi:hypothetical protein
LGEISLIDVTDFSHFLITQMVGILFSMVKIMYVSILTKNSYGYDFPQTHLVTLVVALFT